MTKYIGCEWLEHGIMLDQNNKVRNCCYFNPEYDGRPVIYDDYQGELFDWESFWALKNKYKNDAKNGILPRECTNCDWLKEREYNPDNYINNIILTSWVKCNSKCIYCGVHYDEELLQKEKPYNVLPVMKDFVEKGAFSKDTAFDFAGGEPTICPEFEELLQLFLDNGFSDFVVHTNAVKYSETIAKAVSMGCLKMLISVDAGTKEIHKKIKQVDCFDITWKNIRKYSSMQSEGDRLVRLKYIIVPGINDEISEIEKWLILSKDAGVNFVTLNIDHNWISEKINNVPDKIKDLIDFAMDKAAELEMECQWYPGVTEVQKRREMQAATVDGFVQENQ